jgi:hypothetical protein
MLNYALITFAIAAVGGLILAASVLRGRLAPWALSLVHAALGALGLVLTLMAVLNGAGGVVPIALGILVVAALGGFFLASVHLRGKPGPKAVVVIHALAAVTGVVLLAGAAFSLI